MSLWDNKVRVVDAPQCVKGTVKEENARASEREQECLGKSQHRPGGHLAGLWDFRLATPGMALRVVWVGYALVPQWPTWESNHNS